MNTMMTLLDIAAILVLARGAGRVAQAVGQPRVVGEMATGVTLAMVLQGRHFAAVVLSPDARQALAAVSLVGLVLFIFTLGVESGSQRVRGQGRTVAAIALGSTALPFALGVGLALHLAAGRTSEHRLSLTLFVAATMSITALPVLARIVGDRQLTKTAIGTLSIASASLVDAASWAVLGVIVALSGGAPTWRLLLAVPLVGALLALRPVVRMALRRGDASGVFVLLLAGTFASAAATEWIGLHYVCGAFLFGAVLPCGSDAGFRRRVGELDQVGRNLLLPIFFVVAGMNVDLRSIGRVGLVDVVAILAIAFGGKLVGTYVGARLGGVSHGLAAGIAALMNARGVTELVVLQIGLQLGVIDSGLYSVLVVMALVTTAAATPLLALAARFTGTSYAVGSNESVAEPVPLTPVDTAPDEVTADDVARDDESGNGLPHAA